MIKRLYFAFIFLCNVACFGSEQKSCELAPMSESLLSNDAQQLPVEVKAASEEKQNKAPVTAKQSCKHSINKKCCCKVLNRPVPAWTLGASTVALIAGLVAFALQDQYFTHELADLEQKPDLGDINCYEYRTSLPTDSTVTSGSCFSANPNIGNITNLLEFFLRPNNGTVYGVFRVGCSPMPKKQCEPTQALFVGSKNNKTQQKMHTQKHGKMRKPKMGCGGQDHR